MMRLVVVVVVVVVVDDDVVVVVVVVVDDDDGVDDDAPCSCSSRQKAAHAPFARGAGGSRGHTLTCFMFLCFLCFMFAWRCLDGRVAATAAVIQRARPPARNRWTPALQRRQCSATAVAVAKADAGAAS